VEGTSGAAERASFREGAREAALPSPRRASAVGSGAGLENLFSGPVGAFNRWQRRLRSASVGCATWGVRADSDRGEAPSASHRGGEAQVSRRKPARSAPESDDAAAAHVAVPREPETAPEGSRGRADRSLHALRRKPIGVGARSGIGVQRCVLADRLTADVDEQRVDGEARPVMSGVRARGLAPPINRWGEGHVGSRRGVATPPRRWRARVRGTPSDRGAERALVERRRFGVDQLRVFDETRGEVGAPPQVATPGAFMERQRTTSPPSARKKTPRARGAHRGPRSRAPQDRWRPWLASLQRAVGIRAVSGRIERARASRESEARARRQTHTTRAARGGLDLDERDGAARAAVITSGPGRFVQVRVLCELVAAVGEEHLPRCPRRRKASADAR